MQLSTGLICVTKGIWLAGAVCSAELDNINDTEFSLVFLFTGSQFMQDIHLAPCLTTHPTHWERLAFQNPSLSWHSKKFLGSFRIIFGRTKYPRTIRLVTFDRAVSQRKAQGTPCQSIAGTKIHQ